MQVVPYIFSGTINDDSISKVFVGEEPAKIIEVDGDKRFWYAISHVKDAEVIRVKKDGTQEVVEDSRQLLFDDYKITAIVDTEAYGLGPRELDLITLECSLDREGAKAFRRGYESVDTFPILSKYRRAYRYFFALLQVKGPMDYMKWMNTPSYFDM